MVKCLVRQRSAAARAAHVRSVADEAGCRPNETDVCLLDYSCKQQQLELTSRAGNGTEPSRTIIARTVRTIVRIVPSVMIIPYTLGHLTCVYCMKVDLRLPTIHDGQADGDPTLRY